MMGIALRASYTGLGMVQPDAAGQTPLGKEAQVRDGDLVDLFDGVAIVLVIDVKSQDTQVASLNLSVDEAERLWEIQRGSDKCQVKGCNGPPLGRDAS
jgi:hypothetical protein